MWMEGGPLRMEGGPLRTEGGPLRTEGGPCEDRGEGGHPQAKESGLRRDHLCPHLIPDCSLQDREHSVCGLSPRLWRFVLWLKGRRE